MAHSASSAESCSSVAKTRALEGETATLASGWGIALAFAILACRSDWQKSLLELSIHGEDWLPTVASLQVCFAQVAGLHFDLARQMQVRLMAAG